MKKIKINLPYHSISGTTKETRYQLEVSCNGADYYPVEELKEIVNLSERTLERYIKDFNEREVWRYIIYVNGRRYITPGILFLNRRYRRSLNNQGYSKWLTNFTWNYAFCFGLQNHNKQRARTLMMGYWEKLQCTLAHKKLILFYTIEQYPQSKDYHIHAILGVEAKQPTIKPIVIAKSHFKGSNKEDTWYQKFENNKCYIDYIVKHLHKDGDNHDFYYQNI